jgi:hypothetical protein
VVGMQVSGTRVAAGNHCVQFYADDEDRCASVVPYLRGGLRRGETVVVVAAPVACAGLEAGLGRLGVPTHAARCAGRLMLPDTTALAARLASATALLPEFSCEIGTAIRHAAAAGRPVRVYGETAALLPQACEVSPAVELERAWSGLARQVPFALLCGYPWSLVGRPGAAGVMAAICGLHSGIPGGLPVLPGTEAGCRFPRSGRAPAEARQFVAAMLGAWGMTGLTDDATLLVTELALNAVEHARSGFTVSLSRRCRQRTLRIGVGDASPALPRRRTCPAPRRAGGLDVITAFATQWGHDLTPDGKLVWADLATGSGGKR